MAKDIRQTKVLKHNKEHDIQYNGQRYKTNKSPKTQQRAGTYNKMAKDIRQTKVLKHNKEQDIQYNSQRYKTNKSPKTQTKSKTYNTIAKDIRQAKVFITQQRAGQAIQ